MMKYPFTPRGCIIPPAEFGFVSFVAVSEFHDLNPPYPTYVGGQRPKEPNVCIAYSSVQTALNILYGTSGCRDITVTEASILGVFFARALTTRFKCDGCIADWSEGKPARPCVDRRR
jgi:hypothetical protein